MKIEISMPTESLTRPCCVVYLGGRITEAKPAHEAKALATRMKRAGDKTVYVILSPT